MMAFKGVLSSWLIRDRNSLLARLARSASKRAARSAASVRLISEMSVVVPNHLSIFPLESLKGSALPRCHRYCPSPARRIRNSIS